MVNIVRVHDEMDLVKVPDEMDPFRVPHLGADLWRSAEGWRDEMLRRLAGAGFEDLTPADSDLVVLIGPGGLGLSELARRRGVSKQAAQEKVRALAARQYLRLDPDPADRRALRVSFDARGMAMIEALVAIKQAMQAEAEARLGPEGAASLRTLLAGLRWPGA